ncbi:MAG: acyl-CoA thioesterase [Burkholderiales bacterium]|nr:MAG: acyl-CoA thioesterase [Burkholderiales bacterium]
MPSDPIPSDPGAVPASSAKRFERTYPIRFAHCDAAGIVFYPHYFVILNDHVEDWFGEALQHDFLAWHRDLGLGVPTVRIECDFLAPSRIGERLRFWLEIERLGRSSVTLVRGAECGGEQRLRVRQSLVCIELASGRSRPWPEAVRERMAAFVVPPAPARPIANHATDRPEAP